MAHAIVSKNVAQKLFSGQMLLIKSKIKLQTYTKGFLTALSEFKVNAFVVEWSILLSVSLI